MVEKRPKCFLGQHHDRIRSYRQHCRSTTCIRQKDDHRDRHYCHKIGSTVPGSTTGIVVGVGIRIVNFRAESRISFYCCVDQLPVYEYGMSRHWYLPVGFFTVYYLVVFAVDC